MAHAAVLSPVSIATPSVTTGGIDWGNPIIIGALIALIGVLTTAGVYLYQTHRNAKIEREKLELEREKLETQHRHEQELEKIRLQHEQDMLRLQKELELEYTVKEQEQQQEATRAEALRLKMLRDQTNSERARTYRQALHADPRISHLQILDMSRPLEVTSIYVRVRLHQDTRAGYELESTMRSAEAQHDPNALLLTGFKHLEQRASSAIDPDEAIRTYTHCVIVGDPGAGKTTLLKYLTLKAADNQLSGLPDFPIRLELNAFANSGYQDLLDFAAHDWEERYNFPQADARTYMEERLHAGEALLLLDALDETVIGETTEAAEASYERVAHAIMATTTRYHRSPAVVTARKAGYQQRAKLVGFTELKVLDFRPEDVRQFVTNWFACYQDEQKRANANDLQAKLERSPRIQALAANPLLLSLIVLVYEAQLDLPDRRAELYRRCVDTLLTEWDAKRNIRRRREFKPEHKRQLLAELAWHFHQQGRRYFPESEVLQVIATFLPKVHLRPEQNGQILAEIANEQGLLKEQAKGWQGFLHMTLQEYFVAHYVTDHQLLDALLAHRGDPWWEEVLLLYAGHVPDASPLMHKLLEHDKKGHLQDDLFYTNLLLAGQCLAARPTVQDVSLWETVIAYLFEVLTTTRYSLTQQHVAETLASIGGKEINIHLLQLLSNEQIESSVRSSIAYALGQLGERSVAHELVPLLSNEQIESSVRWSIAAALGWLGERSVVHELVSLLSNEQVDASVRWTIAMALGQLGERSVAHELVPLLSNEQIESSVRHTIAEALGWLGERSVAHELVSLLSNEQVDKSVRWSIAMALGQLGERSVAHELVSLLSNQQVDRYVRQSIAKALGQLGERSVIHELVSLLSNEQVNSSVRWGIATALGQLGERSVIHELMPLLSNEQVDASVRWSIAMALGQLGERSVAHELVSLLSNQQVDRHVRQSIAEALGQLGERSVIHELMPLLSNEQVDASVRQSIAEALGRLGERSVAHELVPLLSNEQVDASVRQSIAEALELLVNDEMTIRSLVELLATSDVADDIQRALWSASRRVGIRISMTHGQEREHLEIGKWSST